MDRRTFIKAGAALPAAGALSGVSELARADAAVGGNWRVFEVTTRVEVLKPAGVTRTWLPLPLVADTSYQKSLGNKWSAEGGEARYLRDPKYNAGIVAAEFPQGAGRPALTLVSTFATRDRAVDVTKRGRVPMEDPQVLRLNLEPTELIPTDGIVAKTADGIVKGVHGDVNRARAIYEWIVENTFRDPSVRGCGWGDIETMLETKNLGGKCGDLNALFVGLARAAGIPARDVYGVRVAPSREGYKSLGANTPNISKAQHCRAEFYARGHGWVPVDPADVRKVVLEEPPGNLTLADEKVRRARRKLFGAWEMNWLAFNYAHDLALPGSTGERIPYFMYPNGETAKGRLDSLDPADFEYVMTAREVKLT